MNSKGDPFDYDDKADKLDLYDMKMDDKLHDIRDNNAPKPTKCTKCNNDITDIIYTYKSSPYCCSCYMMKLRGR